MGSERPGQAALGGAPEALGLADDAAAIPARPGFDLIVTNDMIVEGVHFLPSDPLDLVARKLLRVNLSDLAAKGAQPWGWFLAVACPLAAQPINVALRVSGPGVAVVSPPSSFSPNCAWSCASPRAKASRSGAAVSTSS